MVSAGEDLEIVLITYNRGACLRGTLGQILGDDSPIKGNKITILDNCSTDETGEVVKEYQASNSNLIYRRNAKNLGGDGNIARAFEIATKEYLWIIADDDKYDWSHWGDVERAMEEGSDIIIIRLGDFARGGRSNLGLMVRQLTFLPAGIYRTSNITNDVMQNILLGIPNLFPHLAVVAEVINRGGLIKIAEHEIVYTENDTITYLRGANELHPYFEKMFWFVGFINTIQLVKDKKTRAYIINNLSNKAFGFFSEVSARFKLNRMYYDNSIKNICDVYCGLDVSQRVQFIIALIWLDVIFLIKKYICRDGRYKRKGESR